MTRPSTVALVCVENAGRSQMVAAFAERAATERGPGERVRAEPGGHRAGRPRPRDRRRGDGGGGLDVSGPTPRTPTRGELLACDMVVTMGCEAEDVYPTTGRGDAHDRGLDDPAGRSIGAVRAIRDEIERRVDALLDELAI